MGPMEQRLTELLDATVSALGYELLGVEYLGQGKHSRLRVFIDSPNGIGLGDCEKVSHQISGVMDVEDPITGQYTLEVSSPGLDRPLFKVEHYAQHIGQQAKLRIKQPIAGQRNFQGEILKVVEDEIYIGIENGDELTVTCQEIERANLVPEI